MKRHTDKTQTGETNIEFCWPKSFQCTNSTLTYVTGMNCLLGRILQRFFGRSLQQFFGRSLQQFFGRTLQHFLAELCNIFQSTFRNLPGRTVAEFRPNFATFFGRTLQHFSAELCNIFRSTFRNLPGWTVAEKLPGYWNLNIYLLKKSKQIRSLICVFVFVLISSTDIY